MQGVEILKKSLENMPLVPGVYKMLGKDNKPLYIGKAKNLKNRVTSYANIEKLPYRLKRMVFNIHRVEYLITKTEVEALLLESRLIKENKPQYNILLKDDKSFPYICIDEAHDFPRIYKHRGKKKKQSSYFGPYPSAGNVKEVITTLQKVFLVRPCKDSYFKARTRPCIEYEIKRCSAPCVNLIDKKNYMELIQETKDFLNGKTDDIQTDLKQKMQASSDAMEYEKAAEYRNRIVALNTVLNKQSIYSRNISDADIIAIANVGGTICIQVFFLRSGKILGNKEYFPSQIEGQENAEILQFFILSFYQEKPVPKNILLSEDVSEPEILNTALNELANSKVEISVPKQHGEKLKLVDIALTNAKQSIERKLAENENTEKTLEKIAGIFEIKEKIKRIEVFDNSHIFGAQAIGGMIVAGYDEENKWGFLKSQYRKFNVDAGDKKTGGDDFYMMRQVLTRRYGRIQKEDGNFPDLILIDGGKGQLSIAIKVFKELGLYDKLNFVCIAKGPDRNVGREDFYMPNGRIFKLPENDSALYFLQNLRDEVHRFAITGHRAKRSKALVKSPLDEIPDIGAVRKKSLLAHFGSAKAVKEASLEQLLQVKGISKNLSDQIYNYFRG